MPRGTKRKIEEPSVDEKEPKRIKLDLQFDSTEENQLPDEIVLQLFRLLDRAAVVQCSMACWQWYRVGQGEEFHWTLVTEYDVQEYPKAYYLRRKISKKSIELTQEQKIEELKLWQSDPHHTGQVVRIESKEPDLDIILSMYDDQDHLVAIAKAEYFNKFNFSAKNAFGQLWKYSIQQHTGPSDQQKKKIEGLRYWRIRLFINMKALDSTVLEQNSQVIPNQDTLCTKIHIDWYESSAIEYVRMNGMEKFINRPLKSAVPQRQPDGFKEGINLFKYQLDAITWMKSVEDNIDHDTIYTSAVRWNGSKIYFDAVNEKIVHPRDLHKHIHKENVRGGILADDVGLGKTFEVLGLVLAAPPKDEIEPHPVLIASRSTLIMCPEHISKQWHDEITRATNLKVLLVSDVEALLECTYEDFRSEYDVIVCVYELFESFKYASLPRNRTNNHITKKERDTAVKTALEKLRKTTQDLSHVTAPIIEHFFFHRVVFDEGHQSGKFFLGPNRAMNLSKNVWGRSKWFVSATPFANESFVSFNDIVEFLGLKIDHGDKEDYRKEMIYKDFLWRNTKDAVKDELVVPETVDDVQFIEFSPIERALYLVEGIWHPYRACCTSTYERGLKSVATKYQKKIQENISTNTTHLEVTTQNLDRARQALQSEPNESKRKNLERNVEQMTKNIEKLRRSIRIGQNIVEILEQEIQRLPEKLAQAKSDEEKELIRVQQRHGSKVAAMLVYLKKLFSENPDGRVIIFSLVSHNVISTPINSNQSRYNDIENLLNEHDVPTTSVRGDVHSKIKSIEDFKKEMAPFKVIMMNSTENSAGTNMIEASHVLLLDPPENDDGFETQAIGRAYRQGQTKQISVVRIIFKDSREHVTYLKKNNMPLDGLIEYDPETWKPSQDKEEHASPSKVAKLGRSGSVSGVLASDLKKSLEVQNNTNERKEDNANDEKDENAKGTENNSSKPAPKTTRRSTRKK